MQQIPFIDLFKSALHVSGDKLVHPQEDFLPVTCMNFPSCACLVVLSVSGKKLFEKVPMILKDKAKESIPLK